MALKLHPRTFVVEEARCEMKQLIVSMLERHDLTPPEVITLLADELQHWSKYPLRLERHGDYERKADEA